ncbi:MAG: S1C family serine protease [Candidatus Hydrogenedentota bacterium]
MSIHIRRTTLLTAVVLAVAACHIQCVDAVELMGDTDEAQGEQIAAAPSTSDASSANASPHVSGPMDSIDASRRNALVEAIENTGPAVVTINVISIQRQRVADPFYFDFFDPFGFRRPGRQPRERRVESVGTGFFFDDQGHILTNNHVIENAHEIAVSLPDGRTLDVEVVGQDPITDLAVLKVEDQDVPSAPLGDSDDLYIGEWVIAIGNPFGILMNDPQPSVSVGVVSATNRRVEPQAAPQHRLYQDMIQTDAAINPGNSGGPLVTARGEVVGVNTMIFSDGGGSVGLGFAIPINRARRVVDEILEYGRRRNPWAGFHVTDVRGLQERVAQRLDIATGRGVLVERILEDSPAYRAGLRVGDVITAIDGDPVMSSADVDYAIWSKFVGDTITLEVERRGETREFTFEIVELSR